MRVIAIALAGAVLWGNIAQAQAAFPQTQSEHYRAGQQFASCSAYFRYGADVARAVGLENSAVAIEGMERGWRLAGMFLLVDGLDDSRQTEVETLFENLQAIKVDQLKADRELAEARGVSFDPVAGFQAECGEWEPIQQAIIEALRSGSIS